MKITSLSNKYNNKVLPHALDLEEAVLGAIIIDKNGLSKIIDIITPNIFYKNEHRIIFSSIQKLFYNNEPIDLNTVSNFLRQNGKLEFIGGDYYLMQLTQKVMSSAHIEYHSRIIQQKFIMRSLIELSNDIISKAYDETNDIFGILNYSESKIFEITHNNLKKNFETAQNLIYQAIDKIKKVEKTNGISGISSGFKKIDEITSGWQNSDLIILAGRPGMGKTAFMLSMARNIVIEDNIPVAIFSLEMSSIQIINRLISYETGISSEKIRRAKLSKNDWNTLYKRINKLENSPLFIDDTPSLSIFELRTKCRRLVSQHNIRLIMIDYLQLMGSNINFKHNREQEISLISRSLKSIAKELDIPIIALSQLSRAVEIRGGNKRPLLSDLRESGAIEQDADIVSFIYRPDYYGFINWDNEDGSPCKGQSEIIIAKHRNGSLGNVRMEFIIEQAKFIEIEYNKNKSIYSVNNNIHSIYD